MQRIVLATTIALACISASGQEQQDSLKSVSMMQELQEVVVKGNLPNTRLKGNAMITRIQGTPLSDAGTLGEMLVKVPGMTGTDEAPEVLGKGSPLIYINGRLMRDNSELKRLRSEEIRDVEVINNPGAQYDATVRAVVRIRTVRQQGDGLSLDLTLSDERDLRYDFDRPQAKVGANYRKNGVDVFGSVYYYHQDYRQYSTIEDITTTDKVFRQYGPYTMTWKHDNLTYTAGVNWQLSDNHSLGVRADLTHQMKGKNQVIYDEDVFENNILIDHLYSHQTSKETKPLGWLTNTYYNGKVGKLGIDFNFDFMRNGTDTDRENVEQSKVQDDFVLSKSGTRSRLYAGKLVLSYPVWKGELEAGTEMTFVNRNNTYWIDKAAIKREESQAGLSFPEREQARPEVKALIANSDADITENNVAAFAEYSCDFKKYGWKFDVNLMYRSSGCSNAFYNNTYNLRLGLVAQKSLLKDNSLTLRAAVLDCFQRNRMNEFSDCGYNQIQQNNRFSTHKLMLSLIYRLNATRSKYKGTGAGKDAQARMGS